MDDKMPMEVGLLLFLIFIAISLIVAARAALKSQKKKTAPKRRYRPYQPQTEGTGAQVSVQQQPTRQDTYRAPSTATIMPQPSDSRAAYASADEYFRAGMYDRAKDEYLKTGRVFGAAKSIAAKGREFIGDALQIISRYAPEREEEMVRNLSRYFFDSGETEISALILYESGLEEEADAVLATIGKTIDEITPSGVVEVETIQPVVSDTDMAEFVRCPHCEIPSHYAHIVEWIKVKPQCPNCRKKLVAKMFQS
ncbi:MAG: hypothetical protein ACXABK_05440 [Candidatus Heimdallarchaeaceae archaeon]|jgi:hypothetical protein